MIHHLTPLPFPIPSPALALLNKATTTPISLGSAENALTAYTNINNATLCGICQGLIVMIWSREATHLQEQQQLKDQVLQLDNKVCYYVTLDNVIPEGYKLNNGQLPNFQIPIDNRYYILAKWVKLLPDGKAQGLAQSRSDLPYTINLYALPDPTSTGDEPLQPLPSWF
jgi:hypothetical protein